MDAQNPKTVFRNRRTKIFNFPYVASFSLAAEHLSPFLWNVTLLGNWCPTIRDNATVSFSKAKMSMKSFHGHFVPCKTRHQPPNDVDHITEEWRALLLNETSCKI
jgi:hypothetical protein